MKAVIDYGTNVFKLVIAETEPEFKSIHTREIGVKLGASIDKEGKLTDEAFEKAAAALDELSADIESHGLDKTQALGIATSAIRNASNKRQFLDHLMTRTQIPARILTGEEEAAMTYKGVKLSGCLSQDYALIVDIGGGSIECIIGTDKLSLEQWSVEIGAQILMNEFGHPDQIKAEDQHHISTFLKGHLGSIMDKCCQKECRTLIGTSGTFETLTRALGGAAENACTLIQVKPFRQLLQDIMVKGSDWRGQLPGIEPVRIDMIAYAARILDYMLEYCPFDRILYSRYSVKEGALSLLD